MFCRNCGAELPLSAPYCMKCGVPHDKGNRYCSHCGIEVHPAAGSCHNCGASFICNPYGATAQGKSRLVACLLGVFLGGWGVHDFYLKYYGRAIVHLILGLAFPILYIPYVIIMFMFPSLLGGIIGMAAVLMLAGCCTTASSIWGLVEAVLIICERINTDGEGKMLDK